MIASGNLFILLAVLLGVAEVVIISIAIVKSIKKRVSRQNQAVRRVYERPKSPKDRESFYENSDRVRQRMHRGKPLLSQEGRANL